ncbi:MAG: ferric reductase-like transmembrane domain-containing protein, partial [Miltoncostaeaceae bacterium]
MSLPTLRPPRPGLHWLGPLAVIASVAVSWFAFQGATGEDGSVAFGLFIGAASIVLMAWSFILAVRSRVLEPLFGGLDRMYRVHRWAGALAIGAMFLHTRAEPEIEGGIRGAGEGVADMATNLAGNAEIALYALVGLSVIRWIPYRWWRWTHKLLGIPFALASWHFLTAEKPYDNASAWGVFFGAFMIAGLVAYLGRVLVRDMLARGRRYRVESAEVVGSSLDLRLAPAGRPLRFAAGQFAVLKLQRRGLREPHIFTIASAPEDGELRFFIRRLGDWTGRLHDAEG